MVLLLFLFCSGQMAICSCHSSSSSSPAHSVLYLDYNATTPIYPEARDAMLPWLTTHFGNPSSSHCFGHRAKFAVENARSACTDNLLLLSLTLSLCFLLPSSLCHPQLSCVSCGSSSPLCSSAVTLERFRMCSAVSVRASRSIGWLAWLFSVPHSLLQWQHRIYQLCFEGSGICTQQTRFTYHYISNWTSCCASGHLLPVMSVLFVIIRFFPFSFIHLSSTGYGSIP